VDSITEKDKAERSCSVEARGFEANCASSWVSSLDLFRLENWKPRPGEREASWIPRRSLMVWAGHILQEEESNGIPEE
jgi:hypothetical protein